MWFSFTNIGNLPMALTINTNCNLSYSSVSLCKILIKCYRFKEVICSLSIFKFVWKRQGKVLHSLESLFFERFSELPPPHLDSFHFKRGGFTLPYKFVFILKYFYWFQREVPQVFSNVYIQPFMSFAFPSDSIVIYRYNNIYSMSSRSIISNYNHYI